MSPHFSDVCKVCESDMACFKPFVSFHFRKFQSFIYKMICLNVKKVSTIMELGDEYVGVHYSSYFLYFENFH